MLCTGQRRCRTLSPPAARSVFKKQVFFTSLLSKSLLLRQHLETLLFSRVFCCPFAGISVLCTGQRRCRTLSPPAARSVFKKQVFFTSLLSKSLLLRQHLETLLFSRVFCCLFAGISVLCTGQSRCRTLTFTHLRTQCAHQADNLAKL